MSQRQTSKTTEKVKTVENLTSTMDHYPRNGQIGDADPQSSMSCKSMFRFVLESFYYNLKAGCNEQKRNMPGQKTYSEKVNPQRNSQSEISWHASDIKPH